MTKPYKEFYFDGTKINCFDETSGFTLTISVILSTEYYVNYNEIEATIETVNEGEKEYYDTIAINNLPSGECIEERIARYILFGSIDKRPFCKSYRCAFPTVKTQKDVCKCQDSLNNDWNGRCAYQK